MSWTCIDARLSLCEEFIPLSIVANETGTWKALIEFNGMSLTYDIEVVDGEQISIPNKLNENYAHILRLYDSSGSLVNNTCYTIRTQIVVCNCSDPIENHIQNEITSKPILTETEYQIISE